MDPGKATIVAAVIAGVFLLTATCMSSNQAPSGGTTFNFCSGNEQEGGSTNILCSLFGN